MLLIIDLSFPSSFGSKRFSGSEEMSVRKAGFSYLDQTIPRSRIVSTHPC